MPYLPFVGSGNPSSVQAICGVGLPCAEHLSETAGPGCSVCSMKLYTNDGGASAKQKHIKRNVNISEAVNNYHK